MDVRVFLLTTYSVLPCSKSKKFPQVCCSFCKNIVPGKKNSKKRKKVQCDLRFGEALASPVETCGENDHADEASEGRWGRQRVDQQQQGGSCCQHKLPIQLKQKDLSQGQAPSQRGKVPGVVRQVTSGLLRLYFPVVQHGFGQFLNSISYGSMVFTAGF